MSKGYKALLGGTFNPVHVGHIRLAIEVLEYANLPHPVESVDIIPCATPVFKSPEALLPFGLRLAMLTAACQGIDGLNVSAIEGERIGTSYTYDTLLSYANLFPAKPLLFTLGMENLCDLAYWHHGLHLPYLADLGVVPRAGGEVALFVQTIQKHWPKAKIHDQSTPCPWAEIPADIAFGTSRLGVEHASKNQPGRIFYLPLPRMDISATFVRERWLAGRHVEMLIPQAARKILEQERELTHKLWT